MAVVRTQIPVDAVDDLADDLLTALDGHPQCVAAAACLVAFWYASGTVDMLPASGRGERLLTLTESASKELARLASQAAALSPQAAAVLRDGGTTRVM